jgi:hypothetical protein
MNESLLKERKALVLQEQILYQRLAELAKRIAEIDAYLK